MTNPVTKTVSYSGLEKGKVYLAVGHKDIQGDLVFWNEGQASWCAYSLKDVYEYHSAFLHHVEYEGQVDFVDRANRNLWRDTRYLLVFNFDWFVKNVPPRDLRVVI